MPDAIMPPDGIKSRALREALQPVLRAIKAAAPTAHSASTFRVEGYRDGWQIVSRSMGTTMTELNKRHPVWGGWRWDHWVNQNKNHPERTRFIEKATDRTIDQMVKDAADEYVSLLVDDTAWTKA